MKTFTAFLILPLLLIIFLLAGCSGSGSSGSVSGGLRSNGSESSGSLGNDPAVSILPHSVTTLAGAAQGAMDGVGVTATFINPLGVVLVGNSLFVTDAGASTVRRIDITTGAATSFAGSPGNPGSADGQGAAAQFNTPAGITTDGVNLYVTDAGNYTIRKIVIATGKVSTLAGSAGAWGGADGTGTMARFALPYGITNDGSNLYVADSGNNAIRKITIASGMVTTLAGSGRGSTDGANGSFSFPMGICILGGSLFVTDNYTVRKVDTANGFVTTIAGRAGAYGSADGAGGIARFDGPYGIATDGVRLFVADVGTIRTVDIATGTVATLAGASMNFSATDGTGSAARFYVPAGVTLAGTTLFIADSGNQKIRKLNTSNGEVTTLTGSSPVGSADGVGAAARFNHPAGITTVGLSLFIADAYNDTIRKLDLATGMVTTFAGTPGTWGGSDGIGPAARFTEPGGVTTDGTSLFVADTGNNTIRRIAITTGEVTTLAGTAGVSGSGDGTGTNATFNRPYGVTTDGTNLYVSDTGNHTIRKIVIGTGKVTTLAGSAGVSGSASGSGSAARFMNPTGLTANGENLFVMDTGNCTIRKVEIATGSVTTLAGSPGLSGTNDGSRVDAKFSGPIGVASIGNTLFISDGPAIRQFDLATGYVTTVAGDPATPGFADGTGTAARFGSVYGITTNGKTLFMTDYWNHTIRGLSL